MTRSVALVFALAVLPLPAGAAQASEGRPQIEDLSARLVDGEALVSFHLKSGLSEDALERIDSGLELAFRHQIEIVGSRRMGMFARRVLARAVIETRVAYDSLTGRYRLDRRVDRRGRKKRDTVEPDEESRSTSSSEEMEAWMTQFDDIPVFDPGEGELEPELRVRVSSSVGRRYVMWIFPANVTASAECRLER